MIYAIWYKFKGPDTPWLARDFLSDRARGQFIARFRREFAEWAIDALDRPAFPACTTPDGPPPSHLAVNRGR